MTRGGFGGRGRRSGVAATLEMLGVPCTGSDPVAIGITLDKALAKLMAKAHGIATAPWVAGTTDNRQPTTLRYPLFVKPSSEGSSMGVTAKSLCKNEAELNDAISRVSMYGPALVEEFLPGNEYTVGIIGGEGIAGRAVGSEKGGGSFFYSIVMEGDPKHRLDGLILPPPRAP